MASVISRAQRQLGSPPEAVRQALADYVTVRPAILPEQYSDYRLEAGGQGTGTRVHWRLQATSKRVRDQLLEIEQPSADRLIERDVNSSMITTWMITPAGDAQSLVAVESRWSGAGGIGGFFERTFAPRGLARVHEATLANLESRLRG